MEHQGIKNGRYERKEDEMVDGQLCYSIVVYPADPNYKKIELFVRKKDFISQRIKYYDARGEFTKIYRLLETDVFDGQLVATKAQMWNKKKNHNTFLILKKLKTEKNISPVEFTEETLAQR
jgi:hypothetical protein